MKIRNNKENFVEKFCEINMVETRGELIDYFQKKTFPANGLDSASHGQLEWLSKRQIEYVQKHDQ